MTQVAYNPVFENVGHRIKMRRTELKMWQEELAEKAGYTKQQISQFERGRRRIGLDHLIRIAEALKCPPSHLLADYEPRGRREAA